MKGQAREPRHRPAQTRPAAFRHRCKDGLSNRWCWNEGLAGCKSLNLDTRLTLHRNVLTKDHRAHVKYKSIDLLKGNVWLGGGKGFSDTPPEVSPVTGRHWNATLSNENLPLRKGDLEEYEKTGHRSGKHIYKAREDLLRDLYPEYLKYH